MMLPRNFETNRANAQSSSTGPTSDAGKHIVSQNSLKHGLTARKHACLPGEEEPFEQFCREIHRSPRTRRHHRRGPRRRYRRRPLAPDARPRDGKRSVFRIERSNPTRSIPPPLWPPRRAWLDASKGLKSVALYANRLQRAVEKNTAHLEALQAKRKAAHAQAQEEAILLTQLAEANGETYNPAPDFPSTGAAGEFVYSAPEIARLIARANRLDEVKTHSAQAA